MAQNTGVLDPRLRVHSNVQVPCGAVARAGGAARDCLLLRRLLPDWCLAWVNLELRRLWPAQRRRRVARQALGVDPRQAPGPVGTERLSPIAIDQDRGS